MQPGLPGQLAGSTPRAEKAQGSLEQLALTETEEVLK